LKIQNLSKKIPAANRACAMAASRPAFCRKPTTAFLPNSDPTEIWFGDYWSAGRFPAQMVVKIVPG
jgi:hypothetical protein